MPPVRTGFNPPSSAQVSKEGRGTRAEYLEAHYSGRRSARLLPRKDPGGPSAP